MKNSLNHLTPEEQRRKFESRGMKFPKDTKVRDASKIQEIGYYKLKEFAYIFAKKDNNGFLLLNNGEIQYENVEFKKLLLRYYQDKNLRIFLLHAIEDIEVFLNNEVSTLLGDKYGAFGYLDFKNWCDRKIPKFKIEEQQYFFKKGLLKKIKRSNLPDIKNDKNHNDDGFPTVWMMTDCLTFGDTVYLFKTMSLNNKKRIAKDFGSSPNELNSWLRCMNFIRNACVHNSDLIDIQITTKPVVPKKYAYALFTAKGGVSNNIAIAVLILKYLMDFVNARYKFGNIYDSLFKIIDHNTKEAHQLGFNDYRSLDCLKKRKRWKPHS